MSAPARPRATASAIAFTATFAALVLVMSLFTPADADAFWSASTTANSAGAASTTTVDPGATPTVSVRNRNSVVLSWAATELSNGMPATGYTVSRFDSASAQQQVLAGCSGVITALTCTETAVPDGEWTYTVTPRFQNWLGSASAASTSVRTDATAPVNAITLTAASANVSKTGDVIFYRGSDAGRFQLSNALTDANGSGPASSSTGVLGGTTAGWSHTPSSVSTPTGGPFVSNVISWSAGTTSAPMLGVAGLDAYGNTAPTTLLMRLDNTAPTGGAIDYPNGGTNASTVTVSLGAIADSGSGVNGSIRSLRRQTAPLTGTTCGTFSGFSDIVANPAISGSAVVVPLVAGQCSRYQYTFADAVGNSTTVTSSNTVKAKSYRSSVTATSGLVNYFRLGETGSITTDSVGGRNGTQVGTTPAPGAIAGDSNPSSFYDGVDDYNSVTRTIGGSFTIEFWFRSSQSFGPSNGQWYNGAGLVDAEVAGVANDFGVALVAGRVVAGTGNSDRSIGSSRTYNDDQWHHVVVTRTQGTSITLYVDGVSQGSAATSNIVLASSTTLNFGRLQTGINHYRGYLDEVSLYNRALTATEVAAHFQAGSAG